MGNLRHNDELFALREGWAFSYKLLNNGRRQVIEFYMPGDFIGLEYVAVADPQIEFEALTPLAICAFPAKRLVERMEQDAALATAMGELTVRQNSKLAERLSNIGQQPAVIALGRLLLELYTRASWRKGGCVQGRCFFPVTQGHLADALGLSPEHVNRALHQLRDQSLLDIKQRHLVMHNLEGLKDLTSWDEGYLRPRRAGTCMDASR